MSYTRAQLETVLVRRVGTWFVAGDLDGTSHAGDNDDLNDPIATALQRSGYSVADVTNVADSDIAAVASPDIPQVLDLAELRALETVALTQSTDSVAGLGYSLSATKRMDDAIERLRKTIAARYGLTGGSISGGAAGLDFAETGNSTDE